MEWCDNPRRGLVCRICPKNLKEKWGIFKREKEIQQMMADYEQTSPGMTQYLEEDRKTMIKAWMPEKINQWWPDQLVAHLFALNPNEKLYTTDNRHIYYAWNPRKLTIPDGFYFIEKGSSDDLVTYVTNKKASCKYWNGSYVEVPIYQH